MSSKQNKDEEVIKVILLGNSGVGKTAIINRYYNDYFNLKTLPTMGTIFLRKKITIGDKNILLNLYDTAGQEEYRALGKLYVKNTGVAILLYDITLRKSFEDLDYWYNFIKNELGLNIVLGLAGNKIDLFEKEEVSKNEGKEKAEEWGAFFSLLSAKEDKAGIDKYFENLLKIYLENKHLYNDNILNRSTIRIDDNSISDNSEIYGNDDNCCGGGKAKKESRIKIAFLGAKGVGKTNIIRSIRGKNINKKYEHTKKNSKKNFSYLCNQKKINVSFIDTNGDYSNEKELENILNKCKILFLVFSINNENSFNELDGLIQKISKVGIEKKFINILGNKTDLKEGEAGCVTNDRAKKFAEEHGVSYKDVSIEQIDDINNLISATIYNYITVN